MITIYNFIEKKKHGEEHTTEEIEWFIKKYVDGEITDYQASAWLMAVCLNGMTTRETKDLTIAMMNSGDVLHLDFDKPCIDKHSTGGVGDKVSLFASPVCAACGLYVPKMSGRGLGFTGGTIDKLEAIPGFSTSIPIDEFKKIVRENGCAIAGQTASLVPADKKLYALRNATATVDSIPLICSSIMSKKLATGADGIVLDIKVGDGAFMKLEDKATELGQLMIDVAKSAGRKAVALVTDMGKPLGNTVGNSIEVIEAIENLKGNYTKSFYRVASTIAAGMLVTGEICQSFDEGYKLVEKAVSSGKALEHFRKMIIMQGGDPNIIDNYSLLGKPKRIKEIYADRDGYIKAILCEKTGNCSLLLGAGRQKKGDEVDRTAGIEFLAGIGDKINKGDLIAKLYTSTECDIDLIADEFKKVYTFTDEQPIISDPIIKVIQ